MTSRRRPIVALVTDAIVPYHYGGKEQRTFHVAHHLTAWADVHIYTMKWWDGPQRSLELADGVTLHAIGAYRPLYNGERRSIAQAVMFALACLKLSWRRFDHLEVDSIPVFPLFTTKIVARLRRKQLVSTWHEVWGEDYWREYLGGVGGRLAGWLERKAIHMPDRLVAASPFTADRLSSLVRPDQVVSVSHSGVDLDLIDSAHPDTRTSDLCTVGRLLDHKRVDLLVDAVAHLRSQGRDCRTTVIGNGPEFERLTKHAAKAGVNDLIDFRQDVDNPVALYALLKSSGVFVLPSEREGFGIAVLEAMACGLPVVTTSAPDNAAKDLVAASGFGAVCEPTAEAIARAVLVQLPHTTDEPPVQWLDGYTWRSVAADMAEALQCA